VRTSILLVVALLGAGVSASGETTGNDVLKDCQIAVRYFDNNGGLTSELFDSGWCVGWVSSALELTKMHNEWTDFTNRNRHCCSSVSPLQVSLSVKQSESSSSI